MLYSMSVTKNITISPKYDESSKSMCFVSQSVCGEAHDFKTNSRRVDDDSSFGCPKPSSR